MRLFVLHIQNQIFYSASFRHAMRSMTSVVFPNALSREQARKMDRYPDLARINSAGSFYQLTKYSAQAAGIHHVLIEEHLLDGPPLAETLVRSTDVLKTLDASYVVQSALWRHIEGEQKIDPENIADNVENLIERQLETERATGQSDDEILSHAKQFEERMQGIKIIPQVGSSTRILDKLSPEAAETFLSITDEIK